jgi:hypothetical protein
MKKYIIWLIKATFDDKRDRILYVNDVIYSAVYFKIIDVSFVTSLPLKNKL